MIVGGLALMGDPAAMRAAADGDVWVLYPLGQTGDQIWQIALWFGLTAAGVLVQAAITGKGGRRKRAKAG